MPPQNIVMLCHQNWGMRLGFNAKNLALEFAKTHRVLFVNMPLDLNTVLRGWRDPQLRQRLGGLLAPAAASVEPAGPGLWVHTPPVVGLSINWLAPGPTFERLNRWNSRLLARSIQKAARQVGFEEFHFFLDGLIYQGVELSALLKPLSFTYYLRDYMRAVPYFRRHGAWAEPLLLRQATVVVANSAHLSDYARQHTPRSYDIGQGCVLSRYQADVPQALPPDLAAVSGPRIGYTGYLTTLRLDLPLLLALARQQPQWQLVLVGPDDEEFAASELHGLPNVHFLGNKQPDELPAYVHHFDVCINPQVVNELTVGNYPLKVDEYLAMGRPVVATHTRTMDLFAPYTYLAHSPAEWPALIARALAENGPVPPAARIAFARSHTWEASAGKMYAALAEQGVAL